MLSTHRPLVSCILLPRVAAGATGIQSSQQSWFLAPNPLEQGEWLSVMASQGGPHPCTPDQCFSVTKASLPWPFLLHVSSGPDHPGWPPARTSRRKSSTRQGSPCSGPLLSPLTPPHSELSCSVRSWLTGRGPSLCRTGDDTCLGPQLGQGRAGPRAQTQPGDALVRWGVPSTFGQRHPEASAT